LVFGTVVAASLVAVLSLVGHVCRWVPSGGCVNCKMLTTFCSDWFKGSQSKSSKNNQWPASASLRQELVGSLITRVTGRSRIYCDHLFIHGALLVCVVIVITVAAFSIFVDSDSSIVLCIQRVGRHPGPPHYIIEFGMCKTCSFFSVNGK
jgi:hypothetical protein